MKQLAILMGSVMTMVIASGSVSASGSGSLDQVGSVLHGFKLTRVEKVKEVDGVARFFEHEKTGAQLFFLSNKDDNKVFSIAFHTLPDDNTGLPHILEHSVLCGSRKFPSKEPFVELMKGSVNTFLNAMTYPDKTIYPVASRNDKDFRNLVDVYMDAVLHPRIHANPDTLAQEGWHYEIDEKTGELSYNGVVYNEMKGVFSSPDSALERETLSLLFPDTSYHFESGGEPQFIPALTQEKFSSFHKKYYHPSNSLIYLYGNADVPEYLKFLNDEYLKDFDRQTLPANPNTQKPFAKPKKASAEYSVNPKDATKDKSYLSTAYVVGVNTDPETYLGFNVLSYLLLGTPTAPLKRALLDAGVGKDISGYYEKDVRQGYFAINVKGSSPEKDKLFHETIDKTLAALAKNGINPKLVEAALNRTEFQLREFEVRRYPKGLAYNMVALNSWLYGGDPLVHLRFEPVLEKLRAESKKGYFEKLILEKLLRNPHRVDLVLKPKPGLDLQRAEETKKQLAALKKKMKPEQLEKIQADFKRLKEKQRTPDSPEVLAKLPLLEIKDLNRKSEELPHETDRWDGIEVFKHPQFTNGIAYLNLYFDVTKVPQELLPYAAMLSRVMGRVGTEKYTQQELETEINLNTGGIEFGLPIFESKQTAGAYHPKLRVKGKALVRKLPTLLALMEEVTRRTKFDDRKRLKEIVEEAKSNYESALTTSGIAFPILRASSYLSESARLGDLVHGIGSYEFIKGLAKDFDKRAPELTEKLQQAANAIFTRENLILSISSEEKDIDDNEKLLTGFAKGYPEKKLPAQKYALKVEKENEAFVIPSKVQFVVKVADFRAAGFDYSGKLVVLRNIFSADFLWNRVRVLGGAYGARTNFDRTGTLLFASYRDPNLKETLDIYGQTVDYLKKFDVSPREMTKFVIGTVGDLDAPLTPSMKAEVADSRALEGLTHDDIQRERDEVLSTKVADIRGFSELLEKSFKRAPICVLGGEEKIKQNEALFGRVIRVIE